jgi:hypothetical protein
MSVGEEYRNGYIRTCQTCGHEWEHGRNGRHLCIDKLKSKVAELEQALVYEASVKAKITELEQQNSILLEEVFNKVTVRLMEDMKRYATENFELKAHIKGFEQKYYQNHAELLQIHKMVLSPADHGLEPTGYTAKAVKAIIDQWHRTSDKNAKLVEALKKIEELMRLPERMQQSRCYRIAAAALKEVGRETV